MQILYTTTDVIRSTIGLDSNDLPDAIVNGCNLDLLMEERLLIILPDHENAADDDNTFRRLKLWAQYFCALALIQDASLGIPAKMQANTDVLQRFDVDFVALENNLARRVAILENTLLPTTAAQAAATAAPKLMGKATPDYDPITGV